MILFWGFCFTYLSCSRPGAGVSCTWPRGASRSSVLLREDCRFVVVILGIVSFAFRLHKECPMACWSRSVHVEETQTDTYLPCFSIQTENEEKKF